MLVGIRNKLDKNYIIIGYNPNKIKSIPSLFLSSVCCIPELFLKLIN